jgi:hypothetical protein
MNSNLPNNQGEGSEGREGRKGGGGGRGMQTGRLQPTTTASPAEGTSKEVAVRRQIPKLTLMDHSLLYKIHYGIGR